MFHKNFWTALLTGGIAVNLLDVFVRSGVLKDMFVNNATEMRTEINPLWLILFGFLKIVIFGWFFYKTRRSFGYGARGGMKFGLYYGIALNVPAMFFPYLVYKGVPFHFIWASIGYGLVWGVVLGLIVGKLSEVPNGKNDDPLAEK